jgi:mRNA-degrading endonuclease RelE of RelBE toxin-antitoxin system
LEVRIKKSVFREVEKLPTYVQVLYNKFLDELSKDGLGVQGWELKKMGGASRLYRAKLNQNYRVIMEYVKPDIIIIKVASREGAYK